jgi:hypothetical protein
MPSLYLKVWGGLASGRSSTKWISRPLLRNAITCNRSTTVCARNSISSKIEASGQKEMVVPVRPRGAGPVASSLPVGLPPFSNSMTWCLPSRSISSNSRRGKGVDHRDADSVEAAGYLVPAAFAELRPCVEDGQDDLGRRLPLVLGHRPRRDAATVITDLDPAIGQKGDVDAGAEPGHGLIHRVVDDLPDEVVEPGGAGRPDVHPGPFPDWIQTFKNGDVAGVVRGFTHVPHVLGFQRHRRALSTLFD